MGIKLNKNDLKSVLNKVLLEIIEDGNVSNNDFTKTNEFKSWFGNSKVTDSYGKPLPLYHGSPLGGIEVFKNKDNRGSDSMATISSGLREFGICFTPNIKLAMRYKNNRKLNPSYVDKIKTEISSLEELMYNARNNTDFNRFRSEVDKLKRKLNGGIYQTYLKIERPYVFDAKGKDGYDGWKELKVDLGYKTAVGFDAIEALSGNNDIYKSNYDGIIAKNIIDIHLGDSDAIDEYRDLLGNVYMVFSPDQTLIEKEL